MAHPGGRPLKYQSIEELQPLIDEYFATTPEEEYMVTGLGIALNLDREQIINYGKKDQFADAIKKAKRRIEKSYEKRLITKGRGADIFALKNFGWRDQQDVNLGGQQDNPVVVEFKNIDVE